MDNKITFSFGKNWQDFLKTLDEDRFRIARESITGFMGVENLKGKTLLDIGCGSGLFSHSAFNLGAEKVISFDLDPFSVECCKHLREKVGSPESWQIFEGSILEPQKSLGTFDLVYAWGVLHHTGNMWQAIRNSVDFVAPGGLLYLAIYNRVPGRFGSIFWKRIKEVYNQSPRPVKYLMEKIYIGRFLISNLIRFKNPYQKMRNHAAKRGMDWRVDVKDWLGGYPYQFATVDEVFLFIKNNFPDFNLINLKSVQDTGNNWFVFKRD